MLFRGVVSGSSRRNKGLHVLISLLNRGSGEYGGDWIEDDKAARSGLPPSDSARSFNRGKGTGVFAKRRAAQGRRGREKAACAISRMSDVKSPPNVHVLNVASYVAM